MSKITRMTDDINKMRTDILGWSAGVNSQDDYSATFWQRNKTKLITLTVFGGMVGFFYLLHWTLLFRVSGIMLILYVISNVISIIGSLLKSK